MIEYKNREERRKFYDSVVWKQLRGEMKKRDTMNARNANGKVD